MYNPSGDKMSIRQRLGVPEIAARGHLLEEDAFGTPNMRKSNPNASLDKRRAELVALWDRTPSRHENDPRMSFQDALALALVSTPLSEQTNPKKDTTKSLREVISKRLNLKNPEQARVVPAAETPLDFHGVDGLFIINGIPVTVDVSFRRKEKIGAGKADFYLHGSVSANNREGWLDVVSKKIIGAYEEKVRCLKKKSLSFNEIDSIRTIMNTLGEAIPKESLTDISEILKISATTEQKILSFEERASLRDAERRARLQKPGAKTVFGKK